MCSSIGMAKLLSCILLTFRTEVMADRLKTTKTLNTKDLRAPGPKCIITWTPKDGAKPCTAQLEVKSCGIKCKPYGERHFNTLYPGGFQGEEITLGKRKIKWCQCSSKAGRKLVKVPGACGSPEEAAAKCWDRYKRETTEDYEAEFGAETMRVIPHEERYDLTEFKYDCDPEHLCPEDEDCTQFALPSLWDSRNQREKEMVANLVKKAATGGVGALNKQQREFLKKFVQEDLQEAGILAASEEAEPEVAEQIRAYTNQINDVDDTPLSDSPAESPALVGLYDELGKDSEKGDGTFTVKELKNHYSKLLKGTFINVDKLAAVSGLTDSDHIVTTEEYHQFLKPECP